MGVKGVVAALALVGAVVIGGVIVTGEEVLPLPLPEPNPAVTADRIVIMDGKRIRIVGVRQAKTDEVLPGTPLGDVVEHDIAGVQFEPNALCHVILRAKPVAQDVRMVPAMPALVPHWGVASWPVEIDCDDTDCIWAVLLPPAGCLAAVALPGYLGSTMREFRQLAAPLRARFLRTWADLEIDGQTVLSVVPVGHPKAKPDAVEFVPHGWAGRWGDLNFVKYDRGLQEYRPRVKP